MRRTDRRPGLPFDVPVAAHPEYGDGRAPDAHMTGEPWSRAGRALRAADGRLRKRAKKPVDDLRAHGHKSKPSHARRPRRADGGDVPPAIQNDPSLQAESIIRRGREPLAIQRQYDSRSWDPPVFRSSRIPDDPPGPATFNQRFGAWEVPDNLRGTSAPCGYATGHEDWSGFADADVTEHELDRRHGTRTSSFTRLSRFTG